MAAYGTRLQATADKSLWLLTLVPLRDKLQLKRQVFTVRSSLTFPVVSVLSD